MRKHIYKIDDKGFVSDIEVGTFDTDGNLISHTVEYITMDYPPEYYKPRWTGIKWVEGETKEEKDGREAQRLLESLKPSPSEIADAELEIKMITMLTEMGVIQ